MLVDGRLAGVAITGMCECGVWGMPCASALIQSRSGMACLHPEREAWAVTLLPAEADAHARRGTRQRTTHTNTNVHACARIQYPRIATLDPF
jgi:hypothetical protein